MAYYRGFAAKMRAKKSGKNAEIPKRRIVCARAGDFRAIGLFLPPAVCADIAIFLRKNMFLLTQRFEQALCMACDFHRRQTRKNLPTPFISHPLSVVALVCENIESVCDDPSKCEEYAMIAALHDVIEDQGGMEAYDRVCAAFGKTVADGVLALSDSACAQGAAKPPKRERNALYCEKMSAADLGIVLISCCDKIHNLRSMTADYLCLGARIWDAYTLSPNETVANYGRLLDLYDRRLHGRRIVGVYRRELAQVRAICPDPAQGDTP